MRPDGSACTSATTITSFITDGQCLGAPCTHRILIRTQFNLPGCTGLENNFCDSGVSSNIITREPTTLAAGRAVDPVTWVSYVVPSNPTPSVILPFNLTTLANTDRPLDVMIAIDLNGMSAADWDIFRYVKSHRNEKQQ